MGNKYEYTLVLNCIIYKLQITVIRKTSEHKLKVISE